MNTNFIHLFSNDNRTYLRCSHKVVCNMVNPLGSFVRRNGAMFPLHFQQVIAWILIAFFGITFFGIIAQAFTPEAKAVVLAICGACYLIHVSTLFLCTVLDPADPNVLYGIDRPETIDRTQRHHVIEDGECYFCCVVVGSRSKHCSVCNKCVGEFDHHCNWMNNCVGGRTYR